ncbi:Uncharacterised protein [Mycobacterium tuberculosis]|nr:Uncharacterised protein [Mycobacterium tuberculosis]
MGRNFQKCLHFCKRLPTVAVSASFPCRDEDVTREEHHAKPPRPPRSHRRDPGRRTRRRRLRARRLQRRRPGRRHPDRLVLAGVVVSEMGGRVRRLRRGPPWRHHRVRGLPAHGVQPDPRHRPRRQRRPGHRDAPRLRRRAVGDPVGADRADRRHRRRTRPVRPHGAACRSGQGRRQDLRRPLRLPDHADVLQQDHVRRDGTRGAHGLGRVHRAAGDVAEGGRHPDGARRPRGLGPADVP